LFFFFFPQKRRGDVKSPRKIPTSQIPPRLEEKKGGQERQGVPPHWRFFHVWSAPGFPKTEAREKEGEKKKKKAPPGGGKKPTALVSPKRGEKRGRKKQGTRLALLPSLGAPNGNGGFCLGPTGQSAERGGGKGGTGGKIPTCPPPRAGKKRLSFAGARSPQRREER